MSLISKTLQFNINSPQNASVKKLNVNQPSKSSKVEPPNWNRLVSPTKSLGWLVHKVCGHHSFCFQQIETFGDQESPRVHKKENKHTSTTIGNINRKINSIQMNCLYSAPNQILEASNFLARQVSTSKSTRFVHLSCVSMAHHAHTAFSIPSFHACNDALYAVLLCCSLYDNIFDTYLLKKCIWLLCKCRRKLCNG